MSMVSLTSDSSDGKSWVLFRSKHGAESEERVSPVVENTRSLLVSGMDGKEGTNDEAHDAPAAGFEMGQEIKSLTVMEGEEKEGDAANGSVIVQSNSLTNAALLAGCILHAEEVVPARRLKKKPLVCETVGNTKTPSVRPFPSKENFSGRSRRHALLFDLVVEEMTCRVDIWSEHAVEFHAFFMKERAAIWRIMRQSMEARSDTIGIASNIIATLLDFLLENDFEMSFAEYDAPTPGMIPNRPARQNTQWHLPRMVRPWRKQPVGGNSTPARGGTHPNSGFGKGIVNAIDDNKSNEHQGVINASRIYLLTCISQHTRYRLWGDVLFSTKAKINSFVSLMLSSNSSTKSCGSSNSHSITSTRWISFLRTLRDVSFALRHRVAERRTPSRADAVFITYDLRHTHPMVISTHGKRLTGSSLLPTAPHSTSSYNNNASNHTYSNDADSLYSSLSSYNLLGGSSSAPDASLTHISAVSLTCLNNDSVFASSQKICVRPIRMIVPLLSTADFWTSRDVALSGVPPSRSIYAMCSSSSTKFFLFILRMENFARNEIILTEYDEFCCILRWRERSRPWVSNTSSLLTWVSCSGVLCGFRERNFVAQMLDEKFISATRYEHEIRLMLLYKDFLEIMVEAERNVMEFYEFLRMERDFFFSNKSTSQ